VRPAAGHQQVADGIAERFLGPADQDRGMPGVDAEDSCHLGGGELLSDGQVQHRVLARLQAGGCAPDQGGSLLRGQLVLRARGWVRQIKPLVDVVSGMALTLFVKGRVARDAEQPAPHPAGVAQPRAPLEGLQEGHLGQVLRQGGVPRGAEEEVVDGRGMTLVQLTEGVGVAVQDDTGGEIAIGDHGNAPFQSPRPPETGVECWRRWRRRAEHDARKVLSAR
jgi:hypothetical protein